MSSQDSQPIQFPPIVSDGLALTVRPVAGKIQIAVALQANGRDGQMAITLPLLSKAEPTKLAQQLSCTVLGMDPSGRYG